VIGLALFVIFATGALILFRGEIRQWEEPALRAEAGERASLDALVQPVLDSLGQGESAPSYVYAGLPGDEHENLYLQVNTASGTSHNVWINQTTGAWITNPDDGAVTQTLYYLHFFYQFGRWGLYLAGLIGLFGLLAVTTGTAIHLHRLVKDFFQFRPGKQLRVAWADAHKVLGTIGLPFQTMYVFTGAYFGLVGLVALPYVMLVFDGNATALYREAGYYAPAVQVDSVEHARTESSRLERLAARAERAWTDFDPETMIVHNMGQPDSRVEIIGRRQGTVFAGTGSMVFHGATGEELVRDPPRDAGAFNQTVQSMETLHFADFGGTALKVLFFLLAVASCAVILTGNLTWLQVRDTETRRVNRMLERLTAGVATGFLPATALLFLADRWMPAAATHPGWWTDAVFFGSWGLAVCYALARRNVARTHRTLLVAGGSLALLVPLANGWTTGAWPWAAWAAGQWAVLGVDVGALLCGVAALGIAVGLDVDASSSSGPASQASNDERRPAPAPENMVAVPEEA
jgi:uncharacterized iron-regulated membrane protein